MDLSDSDEFNCVLTMSEKTDHSTGQSERKELPIERGFPVEKVNEIAEKETTGGAREYYRPIYSMHKWWARRAGSVFRAICLYSLVDDPASVEVYEPGGDNSLSAYTDGQTQIEKLLNSIDLSNPNSLWELYSKDVRVSDKSVLDPFMGGGTSLGEASRFGAACTGYDLNPVAWLITKKEMEAHETDPEDLEQAFSNLRSKVKDEIQHYYKTSCPNGDHQTDVMYFLWVKEIDCVSCGETIPLFKDYRVGKGRYKNKGKYNVYCPNCESIDLVDDWQSECQCSNCDYSYVPKEGNVTRGGNSICSSCGQKYGITDAIKEQDGYDLRLYAMEYYCEVCDSQGKDRSEFKDYKEARKDDIDLFEKAKEEWENSDDLHEYIPEQVIPPGHMTSVRNPVFDHGYEKWKDMFNERQLLSLSKILSQIDTVDDQNIKEYLLMAFTGCLNRNNMMIGYDAGHNAINNMFKTNSFDPPQRPAENNVWGLKHGTGPFFRKFEMVKRAVEYAHSPTDRYVKDGETVETPGFEKPLGEDTEVFCDDVRDINAKSEYDAVITDPPYYDNIIYSELSDFFYVWQKIVLEDEYEEFSSDQTSREEIVANPAQEKGAKEFEQELKDAFSVIKKALKKDGVLAFTYHHSDSESWGELLEALCDSGFVVTATYPVAADLNKLAKGESVSFDIIVVARPAVDRTPISWNSLRRNIYRTSQAVHERMTQNRDLSTGDIGVIEMGRCFHEYSKHHGKVMRAGEEMNAKDVVDEIYGIIQQGSEIGTIDVFLDLLETADVSYDDLNKLTRGTDAVPEQMKEMRLYRMEGGEFILGTWDDEKRMAYIQERVNGNEDSLNALDKAQFLRYRYEKGKFTQNYLSKWNVDDELRELCEGLADATGDDTYQRILGADTALGDY